MTTATRPQIVDVLHVTRPPSTFDQNGMRSKLLALVPAGQPGYVVRGHAVAITGFREPWHTAYVSLRGVPEEVAGTVQEVTRYVSALLAVQEATYRGLDVPMPVWRGWPGLRKRWPFLPLLAPAPLSIVPRPRPNTRVYVVKPV